MSTLDILAEALSRQTLGGLLSILAELVLVLLILGGAFALLVIGWGIGV